MNRGSKDTAFEVSDPTDWIPTSLPMLHDVDSTLRCQVCKDFYVTPMTTSCSHTFCSLCIRRSLNNDGKCPACRTPDQELKLKFNGALEDVVEAYKIARPQVMDFVVSANSVKEPPSPKRKRQEAQHEEVGSQRKKTRTSGRRTKSSQSEVVVVDSAEDDDDYIPGEIHKTDNVPLN
jgi:E3 ubiquitin-protein ligase RAD18